MRPWAWYSRRASGDNHRQVRELPDRYELSHGQRDAEAPDRALTAGGRLTRAMSLPVQSHEPGPTALVGGGGRSYDSAMRFLRLAVFGLVGIMVALQLVPYGRDHTNPPVTQDAPWSNAEARRIAVAACYDCHSNETRWRWYSNVAPASWLLQNHVDEGRSTLNFSEWDRPQRLNELAESVTEGSMPPRSYLLVHWSAGLSAAEKETLAVALRELETQGGDRGRRAGS